MKKRTLWIIVMALVTAALAGGGWFWLRYETYGFSALQKPSALEEFSRLLSGDTKFTKSGALRATT